MPEGLWERLDAIRMLYMNHQIDVNRPVLVTVRAGTERALGWSTVLMELWV